MKLSDALRCHSPVTHATESKLAAALQDALAQPGHLVRAQLVFQGCVAQNLCENDALALATAVEYFHHASLLYDDLPCMDNATTRRGRLCLHRTYGDATTILAALALINRAYALMHGVLSGQPSSVRDLAYGCIENTLGAGGIIDGQARDLRYGEQPQPAREVLRIAAKKTGALFLLAVYLPALFGSPNPSEHRALRSICLYWGLLFQIIDDLNDVLSTSAITGKTTGRDRILNRANLVHATGLPNTRDRLTHLLTLATRTIQKLGRDERWDHLVHFHQVYFSDLARQKILLGALSAA